MTSEQRKLRREEDFAGLDVNGGRMVASHFSIRGSKQILDRLVTEKYDPAISQKELAGRIRTMWKKNKMPTRTVHTCLHSRSLIVRGFQYKNLNREELPKVLSLEAEEALQQPPDQIAMDWQLNTPPPANDSEITELSGTLVALPRKTVAQHLNFIQSAGLYTAQVEVSYAAMHNLYTFMTHGTAASPVCLVNLAERTADIIMCSGENEYPRTLFSANGNWDENLDYLLENIRSALLFHHLKARQNPIKKIIIAGRIPAPDQFPAQLSDKAALPVEIMNIRTDIRLKNKQVNIPENLHQQCNLETGIGLGIRRT